MPLHRPTARNRDAVLDGNALYARPSMDELPKNRLTAALDDLEQRSGHDVPIHVDGASGSMVG